MEFEAYVLNTKPLTRADVLITLLTPTGLINVYGKGYQSLKHKFHILVNRGIKVKLYGSHSKNFFKVSDVDLISSSTVLTLDIDIFETYTKIVKLVLYIEHLLDATSFALFDFCITGLEEYNIDLLLDLWKIFVLKKENITLEFTKCVGCGQTHSFKTLSIYDGGLICVNCYTNQPILAVDDIKMINAFYNTKLSVLKGGYNSQVSIFLTELIDQNIGLLIK